MFTGWVSFETDLGWMGVLAASGKILRTVIGHSRQREIKELLGQRRPCVPAEDCQPLVSRFREFCSGQPTSFSDLKIDESWMTPFQWRVIQACRTVPWGETLSYGQLAEIAGSPAASRAVGTVMSKNRFPLIVPCHRICGSNGIGGFSAPQGVDLKLRLLTNEGLELPVAI